MRVPAQTTLARATLAATTLDVAALENLANNLNHLIGAMLPNKIGRIFTGEDTLLDVIQSLNVLDALPCDSENDAAMVVIVQAAAQCSRRLSGARIDPSRAPQDSPAPALCGLRCIPARRQLFPRAHRAW